MPTPKLSILVYTGNTDEVYFRDLLESLVAQDFSGWELWVMDENDAVPIGRYVTEFFPEDNRIHYRKLHTKKGKAYGLNIGFHFMTADHALILDQHTRLGEGALAALAGVLKDHPQTDLLYSDHDEIIGEEIQNSHYKTDFNEELLRHKNYIGENFVLSREAISAIGPMNESLEAAVCYDYLLRASEAKADVAHYGAILFHCHQLPGAIKPHQIRSFLFPWETEEYKKAVKKAAKDYREMVTAANAHLNRLGIAGEAKEAPGHRYWDVNYDGSDYERRHKDYLLLSAEGIRTFQRKPKEILYGYVKQKDVAVAGVRFLNSGFVVDNCGFIYDEKGIYPQFYGMRLSENGYEDLANLPRDVSAVDFDYCMIDADVYRHLGLDPNLTGRDLMLDFCLRAREKGYRTVFVPQVTALRREKQVVSSEDSHNAMLDKWGKALEHDPLYNDNFIVGLENYRLRETNVGNID